MSDLSLYSLKAITTYVRNYSDWLPSQNNPLLPAGLVGEYCCVSYFKNYKVAKELSSEADPIDPGEFRDITRAALSDGAYVLCPNYAQVEQNHFRQHTSILIYPGCKVKIKLYGYLLYQPVLSSVTSVGNQTTCSDPITSQSYPCIEFVSESITRKGFIGLQASVTEYPQSYDDNVLCCPVDCAGSYNYENNTFTFQDNNDLGWRNLIWPISYPSSYLVDEFDKNPAIDYDCAINTFYFGNTYYSSISSFNSRLFYPECLNYKDDTPTVTCNTSRTLSLNLVSFLDHVPTVFCCAGTLGSTEYSLPTYGYETGNTTCDLGYSDHACCGSDPEPSPETQCPCFDVSELNNCLNKRAIDIDFIYENKTGCIATFDLSIPAYYLSQCDGVDTYISVEVLSGGCNSQA
jgi:hypothetical protein